MIGKDFLSLTDYDAADLADWLGIARYLKHRCKAGIREAALAGQTLAMIFEKPSLRTRVSFEVGMTQLGGTSMYIRGEEVGLNTREPAQDVARVLSRYVQGIMIRTFDHSNVEQLAESADIPVINGLTDESHPCQALADLLTIHEHFGTTAGLRIVFIGDGNNVSRSLARACMLSGSEFVLACPEAYAFNDADIKEFGDSWGKQISQCHDPIEAVSGAHVLYSDVWTSMGQEAERDERLNAVQGYQINADLLAHADKQVKIMHCLPAHRGEEITDDAFESDCSIVFDQAENRLHAQKAVMRLLMADDREQVLAAARAFVQENA